MTWNSSVFTRVIIVGAGGELLVYNPAVAAGDLIASIAAMAATDPPGNAVLQGITSYGSLAFGGNAAVQLNSGGLRFQQASSEAGPWSVIASLLLGDVDTSATHLLHISGPAVAVGPGLSSVIYLAPSADATGVTDALYISEAITAGYKLIVLLPGTWYVEAGQVVMGAGQYITGCGRPVTIVNGVGTGDVFRQFATTLTTPGGVYGGGCQNMTIDIGSMGAGSSGYHGGDIFQLNLTELAVRDPSHAGQKGIWLDNQYHWTEQLSGSLYPEQTICQFDNSTGTSLSASATGSFDRLNLSIYPDGKGKNNLVVFASGAFYEGGQLNIWGNTDYGASLFYVLTLTGSNAGGSSRIGRAGGGGNAGLVIDVECNATVGTQPETINFATAGSNTIYAYGSMNFAGSSAFAKAANFFKSFFFDGPVYGDTNLMRRIDLGQFPYDSGVLTTGGAIQTVSSVAKANPSADVAGIILAAGVAGNQFLMVVNDGAGGITFDVTATSHVAGGTAVTIPPKTSMPFYWEDDDGQWYQAAGSAGTTVHSLGTLAGFTVNRGQYNMTTSNELELDIIVTGGGANAASVTFSTTLAAPYIPAATHQLPAATNRNLAAGDPFPRVQVDTSGNVTVLTAANNSDSYYITGRIPLG